MSSSCCPFTSPNLNAPYPHWLIPNYILVNPEFKNSSILCVWGGVYFLMFNLCFFCYVYACFACMLCLYTTHVPGVNEVRRNIRFSGTRNTDSLELMLKLNPGFLNKLPVCLITGPPLQPGGIWLLKISYKQEGKGEV